MNDASTSAGRKLADLRRAFDATFAAPPAGRAAELEHLLTIRIAGDAYAVRQRHVVGLVRAKKIVPLPSSDATLVGLAGVRGGVVPVYDLAGLLGYGAAREAPRWLILCGPAEELVALALAELEGTLALPPSDLCAATAGVARPHAAELARTSAGARAVIDVPSVVRTVSARAAIGARKER